MIKIRWFVAALGFAALGAATTGAQGRARRGPMYDTATVQTISGTIVSVDTVAGRPGLPRGVHLQLKIGTETIPVHLGPTWYLAEQPLAFAAGQVITVRGSRITYEGKPAVIAAEVRRGESALQLRDNNGLPKWRRQPSGRGPAGRVP